MTPVENLSPSNFLAVCDVAMDILEKLQMTTENKVVVPIMRTLIRPAPFNILLPAKSVELLDSYCNFRWTALNYLKNHGVESVKLVESYQRWDNQVEVIVDRKKFDEFYKHLGKVYQKRVVEPAQKENGKEAFSIPTSDQVLTTADEKKIYILEQLKGIWDLRRARQASIAEERYEKWMDKCDIEQLQLQDILISFMGKGLIEDFEFKIVNPAV